MKKYTRIFTGLSALFLTLYPWAQVSAETRSLWDGIREKIIPIGEIGFGYSGGIPTDIRIIAVMVIRVFLTLLVTIFMSLVFYGGYLWMTARGEEERVTRGKETLRNGVIGMAIIVASWSITKFVVSAIVCTVSSYNQWCLFFLGIT